jgi:hypothetical protein
MFSSSAALFIRRHLRFNAWACSLRRDGTGDVWPEVAAVRGSETDIKFGSVELADKLEAGRGLLDTIFLDIVRFLGNVSRLLLTDA